EDEGTDPTDFTKNALATSYTPGGTLDYLISFTLPSNISEYDTMVIWDVPSSYLDYNTSVLTIGGRTVSFDVDNTTPSNVTFTVDLTSLSPPAVAGETVNLTVTFDVDASATGTITNRAGVAYDGDSGGEDEDDGTDPTDFTKTALAFVYVPGGTLDYLIEFTLDDNSSVMVIWDEYPSGLTYNTSELTINSASVTAIVGSTTPGRVTFTVDDLSAFNIGDNVELLITFNVPSSATGTLVNRAGVTYDGLSGGEGDDGGIDETDLTKTSLAVAYVPDGTLDYLIEFTLLDNTSEMVIWDEYPSAVLAYSTYVLTINGAFVPATVDSTTPGWVTFTVDPSAYNVGDSVELLITFDVDENATGTIRNRAGVTYGGLPGGEGEDGGTDKTNFTKRSLVNTYTSNSPIDYLITFTLLNDSGVMVIYDEYPSELSYDSYKLTINGANVTAVVDDTTTPGNVTFTVNLSTYGSFNVGDTVELLITFDVVNASGTITNKAGVTYNGVSGGEDEIGVDQYIQPGKSSFGNASIRDPTSIVHEENRSVPDPDPDPVEEPWYGYMLVILLFPIALAVFLFLWKRRNEENDI
ncbi:MAG: isopeptide-forming domain-containing fimbrial protein, partial [Methanimicrococcus sp.]|nr:isopeptide-forming domain-containing fimbrial protein [Methanimicrococcus sp.]